MFLPNIKVLSKHSLFSKNKKIEGLSHDVSISKILKESKYILFFLYCSLQAQTAQAWASCSRRQRCLDFHLWAVFVVSDLLWATVLAHCRVFRFCPSTIRVWREKVDLVIANHLIIFPVHAIAFHKQMKSDFRLSSILCPYVYIRDKKDNFLMISVPLPLTSNPKLPLLWNHVF